MLNNTEPSTTPSSFRIPLRATYRVQLNPAFGFSDTARLTNYLEALGISHLYCSPYLQATPGSQHNYDVVNYHLVNQGLGGEEDLVRLVQALHSHGMGQVVDMVPNHMAIAGRDNPWWWDVLKNGPSSRYAAYFDVEWDPPEARHKNVVLVPVLGDHYGRVLEAGEVKLTFQEREFTVHYYEHTFPIDPRSASLVLASAVEKAAGLPGVSPAALNRLSFLSGAFERLPASTAIDRTLARRRYQDIEVLYSLLAETCEETPGVKDAIQLAVDAINQDPDSLDVFLELQNYRLAFWRITQQELGYRRFFDINNMIGLQVDDEVVYLDAHARILEWIEDGSIDGLRIDHPDGLRDPGEYFQRLRTAGPNTWIVAEKILEMEEKLPKTWPIHGTTGYDFLNRVNGLLVDAQAEDPLTEFYRRFTGQNLAYADLVYAKKRMAAQDLLGSDLEHLTELFLQVCERNRRYRDYTRTELRSVLAATAACMPVYRTYVRPAEGEASQWDQHYIHRAIEMASAKHPELDSSLFDFLCDLLFLRVRGPVEEELVKRFQQFTGPVMAKGVEDTTFYSYNRFVSLNEVGGNPGRFGFSVEEFHQACAETQAHWPWSTLATSTHDTKRSEDVRARLNVLSEIPEQWITAIERWAAHNDRYRVPASQARSTNEVPAQPWPDRNTEYLLYQILVGAWPIEKERVQQYMEKAVREAKVYTSWRDPNPEYEEAIRQFIDHIDADPEFQSDLAHFAETLVEPGRINSLAQTLLKLTTPGVPDIYQGTELWDLSLVDPDNRRPVNYELRQQLMENCTDDMPLEKIWQQSEAGLPKLWVIRHALSLRRRRPEAFDQNSSYQPQAVPGNRAVAFLRGKHIMTVIPRLSLKNREYWQETFISIPAGNWHNVLSHQTIAGGKVRLSEILASFPVALFEKL